MNVFVLVAAVVLAVTSVGLWLLWREERRRRIRCGYDIAELQRKMERIREDIGDDRYYRVTWNIAPAKSVTQ